MRIYWQLHRSQLREKGFPTERTGQDKASDAGDETREESVEREGADQHAVDELHGASEQNVEQVGVNNLQLGGRGTQVLAPQAAQNIDHRSAVIGEQREREDTEGNGEREIASRVDQKKDLGRHM